DRGGDDPASRPGVLHRRGGSGALPRPLRATHPRQARNRRRRRRATLGERTMKIVLPGGSGQVGTLVARAFATDGHEVVALGRNPGGKVASPETPWRTVGWDARTVGDWAREIDGADVVLNLA